MLLLLTKVSSALQTLQKLKLLVLGSEDVKALVPSGSVAHQSGNSFAISSGVSKCGMRN